MTQTTTRRLWFLSLWLMLPWPLPFLIGPFVPAVRYAILAGVSSAMALLEGGAGPVGMLIVLFALWSVLTTLFCWMIAWGLGRLLSPLSPIQRGSITIGCMAVGLIIALAFDPYATPFGRAARGGLIQVLS